MSATTERQRVGKPSTRQKPLAAAPPPEHPDHPPFPIELPFFSELKRRNVFRVGILYVLGCWLVLDPTDVVFHMLNVPQWANRLVIILMALGLPLVLLFAWAYEVTPEGLKHSSQVDPSQSITHRTGQKLNHAIIVVLSLTVVVLLADRFWFSGRPAAATATERTSNGPSVAVYDKSIAVLPFADLSEKKDQGYFSDGLAEELIDQLTKVTQLHVIARAGISMAEYSLGHAKASQQALDQLIGQYGRFAAYQIAEVYAWRRENNKAFEWLERAYGQRDSGLNLVKVDRMLVSLHGDPRFRMFLRKMKLPA